MRFCAWDVIVFPAPRPKPPPPLSGFLAGGCSRGPADGRAASVLDARQQPVEAALPQAAEHQVAAAPLCLQMLEAARARPAPPAPPPPPAPRAPRARPPPPPNP